MVVAKFALFYMQVKHMLMDTPKLSQPDFTKPPEVFNAVNMVAPIGKFILAMLHPKVLLYPWLTSPS
jgi:hypothetical protein